MWYFTLISINNKSVSGQTFMQRTKGPYKVTQKQKLNTTWFV